jgi:hypothetical protein
MTDYAAQIADLRLFKELEKSAGRDGITQTDVTQLVGMVNHAAAVAGPLLALIPQTFRQYTNHDIGHCRNLIDLMGRFIPAETLKRLNGLELAVLILSALLHDFGMFVKDEERAAFKRNALTSPGYGAFTAGHHARASAVEEARRAGEHERAEAIQDSLLADYFRRMHPQRARENVEANLKDRLVFRELDISDYILDVCESHAWGVYESGDPLHPEKTVSQLPTTHTVHAFPLNLQYIACCLRLADIMDFDRSRTPVVVFQNIDFTDEKSWEEWNKHLSVGGWTINDREVSFRTECTHPSFYVAVMEFLDWVDAELSNCRRLVVKEAPAAVSERYRLHLPPVADRWDVEMKDKTYLAGGFRFQLEYERIMQLLMDKSLYPDPSLFLRELLQNALDACRNMEALAKEYDYKDYTPRIAVWDYSDDPTDPRVVFQDNGVGMSRKIVENYFMRVGRSYYRSPEFDAERARLQQKGIELEATSQFGIGILSCFMVADRFEVETYRKGNTPLHITIEGPTKYFIIKLLDPPPTTPFPTKPTSDHNDGPPRHPGTRLTVHLRPSTALDVYQTLDTFAVNIDYDAAIYRRDAAEPRVLRARRWEAEGIRWDTLPRTIHEDIFEFGGTSLPRIETKIATSEVAGNLKDILAASRIPFERYDFSRHLTGNAWLWLLKDEKGGACPRRGHLRFIGSLHVIGPPATVGYITSSMKADVASDEWKQFLKMLEGKTGSGEMLGNDVGAINIIHVVLGRERAWEQGAFIRDWDNFDTRQRQDILEDLTRLDGSAQPWFYVPGVPGDLISGRHPRSDRPLRFHTPLQVRNAPRAFALHGIRLPAGLVEWNPMTVSARQLELMANVPSGVLVDMRGGEAPTPAASRLFVLSQEGKKSALPFLRACVRHALGFVSDRMEDDDWRKWFDYLVEALIENYYWPDLLNMEFDLLEPVLRYKVILKDGVSMLTAREIVEALGEWVRVQDYQQKREGILLHGSWVSLLVFRERRRMDDGTLEVNMLSKVEVPPEKMSEAIAELEADLESAGIEI